MNIIVRLIISSNKISIHPPFDHFVLLYIRPPPAGDNAYHFIRTLVNQTQVYSFTQ